MGTLTWLLIVAVGVIAGVAMGRFWPLDSLRMRTIEGERDSAREELQRYRQEVSTHFQRTGQLFDRITSDYRSLYEHLSSGAEQLCAPSQADVLQAEPEQRKLALAHAQAAAAVGAAATAGASGVAGSPDGVSEDPTQDFVATDTQRASTSSAAAPESATDPGEPPIETDMSPEEAGDRDAGHAAAQHEPPPASRTPGGDSGSGIDDTAELATLQAAADDAAHDEHESEEDDSAPSAHVGPRGDENRHNGAQRRVSV